MTDDKYIKIMEQIHEKPLILASKSPRRAELLTRIGFEFDIVPSHFDESEIDIRDPREHVKALSLAKAKQVAQDIDTGRIIGADTIVVLDDEILGKPKDADEAYEMLKRLQGRTHEVYTGFAIVEKPQNHIVSDAEVTRVSFRQLEDWEIWGYIGTKSPFDKAGAYGIQDKSAVFAEKIDGCFYNVVGFPLTKFYTQLLTMLNNNEQSKK